MIKYILQIQINVLYLIHHLKLKVMKTQVNKSDYHVHQYMGGQFGICQYSTGGNCIFGGDSANEDHYNEEYINEVFQNWNGELTNNRIEL